MFLNGNNVEQVSNGLFGKEFFFGKVFQKRCKVCRGIFE
jgi:hypothetical protein